MPHFTISRLRVKIHLDWLAAIPFRVCRQSQTRRCLPFSETGGARFVAGPITWQAGCRMLQEHGGDCRRRWRHPTIIGSGDGLILFLLSLCCGPHALIFQNIVPLGLLVERLFRLRRPIHGVDTSGGDVRFGSLPLGLLLREEMWSECPPPALRLVLPSRKARAASVCPCLRGEAPMRPEQSTNVGQRGEKNVGIKHSVLSGVEVCLRRACCWLAARSKVRKAEPNCWAAELKRGEWPHLLQAAAHFVRACSVLPLDEFPPGVSCTAVVSCSRRAAVRCPGPTSGLRRQHAASRAGDDLLRHA